MSVEPLECDVATATPPITIEAFESFLECETKSKLYYQGAAETDSEIKNWIRRERDRFKESGLSWLRTVYQEDEFFVGTLLSKLSNKSVGESSQITSPPQPRYAPSWMLWNLCQRLQIESHRFIDQSGLYQARN
jgi:hypothetical protein